MQFVMRKEGRGEPLICGAALGGKGKGGCHQLGRRGDKEERGQARKNIGLNDTKCHCVSFLGGRIAQSSFFFFSLLGRETECQFFFWKVYSTVCWKTRCVLPLEGGSRRLEEKSLLGATPLASTLLSRFVCGCVDGGLGWLRLSKPVVEDNLSARGGKEEGKKKKERSIVLGQKEFAKSSPHKVFLF